MRTVVGIVEPLAVNLSPLFVDGDIEISTGYVISDSSHSLSIDSLVRRSDGWTERNRATRQNPLTWKSCDLDPITWSTLVRVWP
jgi:hypothetical protein